jgi:hypothetical protein
MPAPEGIYDSTAAAAINQGMHLSHCAARMVNAAARKNWLSLDGDQASLPNFAKVPKIDP